MKKPVIGLIILLTFIVQLTVKAQYLNELKLKENKSGSLVLKKSYDNLPKEPAVAGVLSFIVPGFAFGQIYNEQPVKALIHTAITVTSLITAVISLSGISFSVGGSTSNDKSWGGLPFLISLGVFTGNWVWSVVDAVISANNINKQTKLQKYRSDVMDKLKFGITYNKNKQLNFKFALDL